MIRIASSEIQSFETEHIAAVRKAAPECTVLLKSDGTLPWKAAGKLALYGNGARNTIKGGTGSGDVNVRHFVSIEEGLTNAGFTITSGAWLDHYDSIVAAARKVFIGKICAEAKAAGQPAALFAMGRVMDEPEYEYPMDAAGDSAVYVLARNSGEGSDRTGKAGDVNLTSSEIRDILCANEKYENFVLVLNVGGMVNLEPVKDVKNILLLGQLGTPTGDVLADLLLGKSYPSGKLTMTWAPIEAYPSTDNFGDINDTRYKEGIYVGYRYFDTAGVAPVYPFGYGLSYTDFSIEPKGFCADAKEVAVTVAVRNTGTFAGKEVVQVYCSAPAGRLDKPAQELKGYAKTKELAPGESCEVTVVLPTESLASYDTEQAAYILEKGRYLFRAGSHSRNTVPCGALLLEETVTTKRLGNICPGADFTDLTLAAKADDTAVPADLPVITLSAKDFGMEIVLYAGLPKELPASAPCTFDEVKAGKRSLDDFVGNLTGEQMTYLCIGAFHEGNEDAMSIIGNASSTLAGAAGETTHKLEALGVAPIVMSDGPAGIRISTSYKIVDNAVKACGGSLAAFEEFMTPEEKEAMAAMMPKPSKEELEAPVYYQYCVAIPIGTCLAQSFNSGLCEAMGDLVGDEMEQFGVQLWLAPALNIHRSPLCGRNFEYYSEDPLVSGKVAAAITNGVQCHKGCATTIKHYACNNQETNRYASNSIVSERALREIYLKGFEICVKESQPHALMTSYNLINGEHACNSYDILTRVLREEWGYQGVVMTDWLVTQSMMKNPEGIHPIASAAGCVKAGNDIVMPGGPTDKADIQKGLQDAAHPYALTKAELQVCAKRVLECALKLAE